MKMRRLISAIIALLLVVNLSVTAFAAEWYLEDGDITVSAGDSGQTVSQGGGAAVEDNAPVIKGKLDGKHRHHQCGERPDRKRHHSGCKH